MNASDLAKDRPSTGAGCRVGIISDTHGLLRPEAVEALRGVSLIVHAGDICDETTLEVLGAIAPVVAVRGNNDRRGVAGRLPETEYVERAGVAMYVLHDLEALDLDPGAAGVRVVIHGHTHRPSAEERAGVLYVNPGSAGPRRGALPVTLGIMTLEDGVVRTFEHIALRPNV